MNPIAQDASNALMGAAQAATMAAQLGARLLADAEQEHLRLAEALRKSEEKAQELGRAVAALTSEIALVNAKLCAQVDARDAPILQARRTEGGVELPVYDLVTETMLFERLEADVRTLLGTKWSKALRESMRRAVNTLDEIRARQRRSDAG